MSLHRVNLLDVLRTQASSEAENRQRVLKYYGSLLAGVLVADVVCAAALVAAYADGDWRAAWAPFARGDFAFGETLGGT